MIAHPDTGRDCNFLARCRTPSRDHHQSCSEHQLEHPSIDFWRPQRTEWLVLDSLLLSDASCAEAALMVFCGFDRATCWSRDATSRRPRGSCRGLPASLAHTVTSVRSLNGSRRGVVAPSTKGLREVLRWRSAFSGTFLRFQVQLHGGLSPQPLDFFGSRYTARFLRSLKNLFFVGQETRKVRSIKTCFLLVEWWQEGGMEERRRTAAPYLQCWPLVPAMCFAFRPDPKHVISSGNQCCDQNLCQHSTYQQQQKLEETSTQKL